MLLITDFPDANGKAEFRESKRVYGLDEVTSSEPEAVEAVTLISLLSLAVSRTLSRGFYSAVRGNPGRYTGTHCIHSGVASSRSGLAGIEFPMESSKHFRGHEAHTCE